MNKIKLLISKLSITEKILAIFLVFIFLFTGHILLEKIAQKYFFVEVPLNGGSITEGSIGSPRFINPLLAISETDRDLTSLIYSGLLRSSKNGELIPDLAEKYEISEDGLQYTFYIKKNATFHDGKSVTADDVIFTVNKSKDIELKSPKRSNWEGVEAEKIDDHTVVFVLNKPYAPFLQNTTIGILPKHIWGDINSNEFSLSIFNVEPVGSGPFMIDSIKRDSLGIPKNYNLKAFSKFVLGRPHLDKINFVFVKNESELENLVKSGDADAIHGINPETAEKLSKDGFNILGATLPRIFGLFLNQSESEVLGSAAVRKALAVSVPRGKIISEVFRGFGEEISDPVPNSLNRRLNIEEAGSDKSENPSAEVEKILTKAGWEKNEEGIYVFNKKDNKKKLSFSISTSNVPELVHSAEILVSEWKSMGIDVDLKIFEPNDFNQNIIRPRNYQSILFGLVVGRDMDLYAFWHSSQRNDPGLNISQYANIKTDSILEEIRKTSDQKIINEKILSFEQEIGKDNPAIFIYSPKFIFILPKDLKGTDFSNIVSTEDRFFNVFEWYFKTERVLRFFTKN